MPFYAIFAHCPFFIFLSLRETTEKQISDLQHLLEASQNETKEANENNSELELVLKQQKSYMSMQHEKLTDLQGMIQEREVQVAQLEAQMASQRLELNSQIEDLSQQLKK